MSRTIALPMMAAGAKLVVSLLGVEAWRPLRLREHFTVGRAKLLVAISQHTIDGFHAANPKLKDVPISVCHLCLPDEGNFADGTRGKNNFSQEPFALIVARMASEERY